MTRFRIIRRAFQSQLTNLGGKAVEEWLRPRDRLTRDLPFSSPAYSLWRPMIVEVVTGEWPLGPVLRPTVASCIHVYMPPHVWSGKPNGAPDRQLVGLRNYQYVPPKLKPFRFSFAAQRRLRTGAASALEKGG